jgi:hypothetical protein
MPSWRFFSKTMNGEGYAFTRWFWAVERDVAPPLKASAGFETLKACEADAARSGFHAGDAADYETVEFRTQL